MLQGRRKLCYGGGGGGGAGGGAWVKMFATMVDRQRKIKKKHWLKRPNAVPQKTKIEP